MAEFYQACISCRTSLKAPSVDGLCETCRTARTTRKSQPTDQPTKSFDPSLTRSAEPNRNDTPQDRRALPPDPPGFTLHRELGHGGTAVVYLAKQHGTERECAIKYVQHFHLKSMRERLEREVRALGRLDHPHILPIYQCSLDEAFPYFVMEYAPHGSLSDALKASPKGLPLDEALKHLIALTEAVVAAHEAGIVHRDLKPGNLLLDREKQLKVADFGLARHLENDPTITRTDAVIGTPAYMSPEQAKGETATAKSDIYGIGAVGYSLVTGKPPHGGTDHRKTLADAIAKDVVPPDWHRKDLPPHFSAVLEKCLDRNPAKRYPTAKDLLADLVALRDGKVTIAQPMSVVGRVLKVVKRQSRWAIAAVCLVAIGAIAAAVIPKRAPSAEHAKLSQESVTKRLQSGLPVTVFHQTAPNVDLFPMLGKPHADQVVNTKETCYSSVDLGLIGLIREPGVTHYRIDCELCQLKNLTPTNSVGVRNEVIEHVGLAITTSEYQFENQSKFLGRMVNWSEPEQGVFRNRKVRIRHFFSGLDRPSGNHSVRFAGGNQMPTPLAFGNEPQWRKIRIDVNPRMISVTHRGETMTLDAEHGDGSWPLLEASMAPDGASGILIHETPRVSIALSVYQATIGIRNMIVTPTRETSHP